MASWAELLNELSVLGSDGKPVMNVDLLRKNKLDQLYRLTNRNVIAYYSGFLTFLSERSNIEDNDLNGFMNAIYKLDRSKGLDLILHTPGGTISSACAIVSYLKNLFSKDIRCIVPQVAMSAGTMIACACKEIYMGKHSSIGPIDPQFGVISTGDVIEEAARAKKEMASQQGTIPYWSSLLAKYPPAFIGKCEKAVQFAMENVEAWLTDNMFATAENPREVAKTIVSELSDHIKTRQHDKHISADEAQELGLKIIPIEEDSRLQDAILSVHHAYMLTFSSNARVAKIIENQNGCAMVTFHNQKPNT